MDGFEYVLLVLNLNTKLNIIYINVYGIVFDDIVVI